MPDERDDLRALRDLWRAAEPPAADAGADDARADAETRAALAWTRAAWSALEAPPATVPFALQRKRLKRTWPRLVPLAAAAALVLAPLALRLLAPAPAPVEVVGQHEPPPERPRVVVDTSNDRTELSVGTVRLILVSPEEPAPSANESERTDAMEDEG